MVVQFAGTTQLAALGPASVIFSFASYVFNALGIATTTIISRHVAVGHSEEAATAATTSLVVALGCGVAMSALLQTFGAQLIAATRAVDTLQGPALAYLRVRAFAQPALLVSIVTQSCLLAQRDSRSPALSVMLQVAVNASLDISLIVCAGAGVVGAAWATVAAQYLGMLLLLQRMQTTGTVQYVWDVRAAVARVAGLWRVLAPLVIVYVARNLCYMLLQVCPIHSRLSTLVLCLWHPVL